MQIPGLNLLNAGEPGTVATSRGASPVPAEDSAPSQSVTPNDFLTTNLIASEPLPVAPSLSSEDPIDPEEASASGGETEMIPENSAIPGDEDLKRMPAEVTLDALDIALEEESDQSSVSSDNEESDDSERYSYFVDVLICSSTSSESDDDLREITRKAELGFLEGLEEEEDDMEDVVAGKATGARTKNEVNEDMGPVKVEHTSIEEGTAMELLGLVEKVMDTVAIIRANTNGEYRVLDEGALVVTDARKIVGTVISF
jgi:hypothetical protein